MFKTLIEGERKKWLKLITFQWNSLELLVFVSKRPKNKDIIDSRDFREDLGEEDDDVDEESVQITLIIIMNLKSQWQAEGTALLVFTSITVENKISFCLSNETSSGINEHFTAAENANH